MTQETCVVIGASHAGVNFAFALRSGGWTGAIILIDRDPVMPYHRPPLSKTQLCDMEVTENLLMPAERYEKDKVQLLLGQSINRIDRERKILALENGEEQGYDKLVLATGASPLIPPIAGLAQCQSVFALRTTADVAEIRQAFLRSDKKRVVVIGAGYIGLEAAASLRKEGGQVTVIEREDRVLSRVATPKLSAFFEALHRGHGVELITGAEVSAMRPSEGGQEVVCSNGAVIEADLVIIGVGIRVNTEIGEQAGLTIDNGFKVNAACQTSDPDIFAIGDCTNHYNPYYKTWLRLESIQNAVDQAKTAASAINGEEAVYHAIPWFWSDQYDVKLQMVGLWQGYHEVVAREENLAEEKFSLWYFKDGQLLAVDAVNSPKAFVVGTKVIKDQLRIDRSKLADPSEDLKPANLVVSE